MKPSILIVDGDRAMVRMLCDSLRLRGWETGRAYSGEEAIQAQRDCQFSCVLMDITMPGVNGIAAFRVMKERCPDLRVILMTGHASSQNTQDAINEGVWQVLPKPLDLAALFAMLG